MRPVSSRLPATALPFLCVLSILSGCSNDDVPSEDITRNVHPESYGVQLPEMKLMDKEKTLHWLQEYVTGYSVPGDSDGPAIIRALPTVSSCSLPKPAAGSMVAQVVTDHGNGKTSFYAMSAGQVDQMGKMLAAMVKSNRNPSIMLGKTEGRLSRIDVIVTETAKPVHLILASRSGALWNIHKVPGARLSAVTLVSETPNTAIANVDAGVPLSAITGEMAKRCGAIPAVEPVDEYPGLRMQIHKDYGGEKVIDKLNAAWSTYSSFFLRTYGQRPHDLSVGTSAIYHAAVGPVPAALEDRAVYNNLKGATIHVTAAALVFYGSEGDYAAARRTAAIAAASKATGGDYQSAMEQAGY